MKMFHLFFAGLISGGVVQAQDSGQNPSSSTNGTNLAQPMVEAFADRE